MKRIVFELTVEAPDAGNRTDEQEVEDIVACVLDGMGFPFNVNCSVEKT